MKMPSNLKEMIEKDVNSGPIAWVGFDDEGSWLLSSYWDLDDPSSSQDGRVLSSELRDLPIIWFATGLELKRLTGTDGWVSRDLEAYRSWEEFWEHWGDDHPSWTWESLYGQEVVTTVKLVTPEEIETLLVDAVAASHDIEERTSASVVMVGEVAVVSITHKKKS